MRFIMDSHKLANKPITIDTKLSKQDEGPTINSTLYKKLVGSIKYLTKTRPTLMYGVGFIFIFMESPKYSNQKVGKIILRYVAGTTHYGLLYTMPEDNNFTIYIDNEFVDIIDDRKTTSGYAFHLGIILIS